MKKRWLELGFMGSWGLFGACSANDLGRGHHPNFDGNDELVTGNQGDGDLAAAGDGDGDRDLGLPPSEDDPENGNLGGASGAGGAPAPLPSTNPFVAVEHDPLSTFAADVDTASYDLFRARASLGSVDPSTIRLEEFVNYFSYDYPAPDPKSSTPFSIHLSAAPSLATRDTQLLRVGIQAKEVESLPPTNLVFLVDVSGSMSQNLPVVQHTLKQTLELLDPEDRVSIVTYAGSAGTLLSSTPVSEKDTITAAVDALVSGGSTNGEGGIRAAYAEAEGGRLDDGINHILLCTDGDFNVGLSSIDALEELVAQKRKSGITLTALGYGGRNFNDQLMERISNIGNGVYAYIGTEALAEKYVAERMLQSMVHVAKDMKLQVEFNPAHVAAYRLLGYENRAIFDDDFRDDLIDAGEVGSGHRVTALYEIALSLDEIPAGSKHVPLDDGADFSGTPEVSADDLVLVKVRYKEPGAAETDEAREVSSSLAPSEVASGFEDTHSDFQYASAVAAFAEILKESPYANGDALPAINVILQKQATRDDDRNEFWQLVQTYTSAKN